MFDVFGLIEGINLIDGGVGDLVVGGIGDWGLGDWDLNGGSDLAFAGDWDLNGGGGGDWGLEPEALRRDPEFVPPPPPLRPPSEGIRWGDIFLLISVLVVVGGAFIYFENRSEKSSEPAPEPEPEETT